MYRHSTATAYLKGLFSFLFRFSVVKVALMTKVRQAKAMGDDEVLPNRVVNVRTKARIVQYKL